MLAHHFSHYYNRRCQRMVLELTGVISLWESEYVCVCVCDVIVYQPKVCMYGDMIVASIEDNLRLRDLQPMK